MQFFTDSLLATHQANQQLLPLAGETVLVRDNTNAPTCISIERVARFLWCRAWKFSVQAIDPSKTGHIRRFCSDGTIVSGVASSNLLPSFLKKNSLAITNFNV